MNEIWRPAVVEGYEVSNLGRVRSLKSGEPKLLNPETDRKGYLRATLMVDGKHKHFFVHRLVAMAFIPNPESKPEVNHIDGNPKNNCVENLEWCTSSENHRHAFATGLRKAPQGEDSPQAKLTAEQVIYVRDNPDNLSLKQLAEKFNVSTMTIGDVQLGTYYRNVGGKIRKSLNKPVPEEIRAQIRAEYKPGVYGCGCHVLARKFGVDQTTVMRIVRETI